MNKRAITGFGCSVRTCYQGRGHVSTRGQRTAVFNDAAGAVLSAMGNTTYRAGRASWLNTSLLAEAASTLRRM